MGLWVPSELKLVKLVTQVILQAGEKQVVWIDAWGNLFIIDYNRGSACALGLRKREIRLEIV